MSRQLPTQRRDRLLALLRTRGALRVRDVAAELGVSQPTVRRDLTLLADRGLITRAHGGALAMNAPRSTEGRQPRASWVIGMVAPSLDYYFPAIAQGAKAAADARGARLVLRGSEYDTTADREHVGSLVAHTGVHGLLIAPEVRGEGSTELLHWLDSLPIPVVLVERQPPADLHLEQLQWVATDHRRGGAAAVEHLHAQGHRWIGLFGTDNITGAQVAHGWRAALTSYGIDHTQQLVGPMGSFHRNGGTGSAINDVITRVREGMLTALIVQPDPDAIALLQRCSEAGIRVPEDLAVVAYDDEVASMGEPPLTAVQPVKHHLGRMAMDVLLARLRQGPESPLQQLLVRPQLVVRESSVGHRSQG